MTDRIICGNKFSKRLPVITCDRRHGHSGEHASIYRDCVWPNKSTYRHPDADDTRFAFLPTEEDSE